MNKNPENPNPQSRPQSEPVDSAAQPGEINPGSASTANDANPGNSMLTDLQLQLAEAEKRVLIAQADLENFRRRTRQNAEEQIRYASLGLMNEILESVDNLHRAIEAHVGDPDGKGLAEGVQLIASQITTALAKHGCEKIAAMGEPFNPTYHQAVSVQPSDDQPPNTVMLELRAGYRLHDRVIRPSQVIVASE